ncbi:MAG: NAD(+)/NADH kinase [Lachnospiraceae bacterium]|nr:NAD(+)/NADH kinase [Lachnospiraceae bacterium]
MDRFFVITNENRDPGGERAEQTAEYLRSRGKTCDFVSIERDSDPNSKEIKKIKNIPDDTEAVIVLGGDGTFIQSAGILAAKNIPMIGVNIGHLGYLAEVDKDEITPALDRLMNDDYTVEERMLLSGTPVINESERGDFIAVNDIVVKTPGSSVGTFRIEVNGTYLTTISGDGVIVATPTGSTAYNMSAGGPIIEPGSSMIVVTPICPLEVVSRSVVLSSKDTVVIKLINPKGSRKKSAGVYFDGAVEHTLSNDDRVVIKKAESSIRLIKLSKESFLEVLSRKMS